MAPPMPIGMRSDRAPKKAEVVRPVGRYFAGKGEEARNSDSDEDDDADEQRKVHEDSEDEETEEKNSRIDVNLKTVNLERHYQQESIIEAERLAIARAAEAKEEEGSSDYETDEGSEYESDPEPEPEAPRRVLTKPVFMTKAQRESLKSGVAATETSNGSDTPQDFDDHQKRRTEARELIEIEIRAEAARNSNTHQELEDVDDTDGLDPEAEHAAWKLRELLRIKRDREALERRETEREEIEARRAMPEEARMAEDLQRVKDQTEAKAAERKALMEESTTSQKYHHVGAFYQDDQVVQRAKKQGGVIEDTGSSHGLRGATRWKGLKDQDTSRPVLRDPRDVRDDRPRYSDRSTRDGVYGSGSNAERVLDESERKRRDQSRPLDSDDRKRQRM